MQAAGNGVVPPVEWWRSQCAPPCCWVLPQAAHSLLPADPDHRPSMHSVMVHPLWWPPPQRLAFLIAVSDRVEGEDRAVR